MRSPETAGQRLRPFEIGVGVAVRLSPPRGGPLRPAVQRSARPLKFWRTGSGDGWAPVFRHRLVGPRCDQQIASCGSAMANCRIRGQKSADMMARDIRCRLRDLAGFRAALPGARGFQRAVRGCRPEVCAALGGVFRALVALVESAPADPPLTEGGRGLDRDARWQAVVPIGVDRDGGIDAEPLGNELPRRIRERRCLLP